MRKTEEQWRELVVSFVKGKMKESGVTYEDGATPRAVRLQGSAGFVHNEASKRGILGDLSSRLSLWDLKV